MARANKIVVMNRLMCLGNTLWAIVCQDFKFRMCDVLIFASFMLFESDFISEFDCFSF